MIEFIRGNLCKRVISGQECNMQEKEIEDFDGLNCMMVSLMPTWESEPGHSVQFIYRFNSYYSILTTFFAMKL